MAYVYRLCRCHHFTIASKPPTRQDKTGLDRKTKTATHLHEESLGWLASKFTLTRADFASASSSWQHKGAPHSAAAIADDGLTKYLTPGAEILSVGVAGTLWPVSPSLLVGPQPKSGPA